MALQGTVESFPLPDVLRLLAATRKSGCLHVEGDRGRAAVWVSDGMLIGADAGTGTNVTLDEAMFEVLRFETGSFMFEVGDSSAPRAEQAQAIEQTLIRATQMLEEWRDLQDVVPSLEHHVGLVPDLPGPDVLLDRADWATIAAIAGGCSVGELAERLGVGELTVTRLVSHIVHLGVAIVDEPSTSRNRYTPAAPIAAAR